MVALQGHTPPFVLRARNGDGGSRVAAAWVWLDGQQVLGPDDFSLNTIEHERVVDAREGSVLRVQVVGAAGSSLSVEIAGERPDTEQIVLTPDGGHYELRSGAVLDVPPGAVDQDRRIFVCGVSASSAQPRLDANVLQPQYFAAGIQGVPSGLTFNVPVTITMPSTPSRSPADVPVAFLLEPRGSAFSLAATNMQHDPTNNLIRARVSHFSTWVYAFAEDVIANIDCRDRANWCRCFGLREIIQSDSDSTIGDECYEASSEVLVTLLECPGQPQQGDRVRAKEVPRVRIDPPDPKVSMCDAGISLNAVGIHATEPRERPLLNPTWDDPLPNIASVSSSGVVQPHADGCKAIWDSGRLDVCRAPIEVSGSCHAWGQTYVEVVGPRTLVPLEAPPTLVVGGTHTLTTLARDGNGTSLECEPIDWSSSNDGVVTVVGGVLTAHSKGEAVITASARHNSTAESQVLVKVRSDDDCDRVACTLMVEVAVQPTVKRCSGTADACVYTGDGGLRLSAWVRDDATGRRVKRELAWAAVPVTGSVELAPAVDPDPAVTSVQVKGHVPGMVTMQAFDPSSDRSATLKVHVVPWLFQATATSTTTGEDYCRYPARCGRPEWTCYVSGQCQGGLTVRLPGPRPPPEFEWSPLSGYVTISGPSCYQSVTQEYLPGFGTFSPLTISGSTVSYHWEWDGPCYRAGSGVDHQERDLTATYDDTAITGTYVFTSHCVVAAGIEAFWTDTLPFRLSAVAVQP